MGCRSKMSRLIGLRIGKDESSDGRSRTVAGRSEGQEHGNDLQDSHSWVANGHLHRLAYQAGLCHRDRFCDRAKGERKIHGVRARVKDAEEGGAELSQWHASDVGWGMEPEHERRKSGQIGEEIRAGVVDSILLWV